MSDSPLPEPPPGFVPAAASVRRRWIGRSVRISKRLFRDPEPWDPFALETRARQMLYREWGVGIVRDVGRRQFLVEWQNGDIEQMARKDMRVLPPP